MAASGLVSRILKIEPGISLGQWIADRITHNWNSLVSIFVGLGGMSYLGLLTDWVRAWGPVGVGGIGLFSALLMWIGLSWAQLLRDRAEERRARAKAIEKWKDEVDSINPMEEQFNRRRIAISDLINPLTKAAEGKTFVDCELYGPAVIVFINSTLVDVTFRGCDIVVVPDIEQISNVTYLS
jgi:hypothetical protein